MGVVNVVKSLSACLGPLVTGLRRGRRRVACRLRAVRRPVDRLCPGAPVLFWPCQG